MKCKGMIFDLDGTLADSMYVWKQVDEQWLLKHEIPYTKEIAHAFKSMSFRECAHYMAENYPICQSPDEIMKEWNDLAIWEYENKVPLKKGVRHFLEKMKEKGIVMAIATSCFPKACMAVLKQHDIAHFFEGIIYTDDVGKNKHFPDVYLEAAKMLETEPKDCIVFEDILAALEGIKAAKMRAFAVYDEASKSDWEDIQKSADYAFLSFEELINEKVF